MSGLHLNSDTEINLYRIVQEALHNIQKHSGANRVVVRIIASYPTIILRIEDNGKGFDKKVRLERSFAEKRMGVRSMEERASLLQGKIDIRSQVGKGTKIMVEIPLWCNTRNTIEEGEEDNERKCI
jgi:signal transduction histidine kinase